MVASILVPILKVLLFAVLSFVAGAVLGFITRQVMKLVLIAVFLVLTAFAADISGYVDTGVDWISMFNGIIDSIGLQGLVNGAITFAAEAFKGAATGEEGAAATVSFAKPLATLLMLTVIVVPFLLGFLKALHPSTSE